MGQERIPNKEKNMKKQQYSEATWENKDGKVASRQFSALLPQAIIKLIR